MPGKKKPIGPKKDFKQMAQVLATLLEARATEGVPPDIQQILVAVATSNRRPAAALALLLALGVECRSAKTPRPLLESVHQWIPWAGSTTGLAPQQAALLTELLTSTHIEAELGKRALALFSLFAKGALGETAWAAVRKYQLEVTLADVLRRLGDVAATTQFQSRLSKYLRDLRKVSEVRADPASIAQVLFAFAPTQEVVETPPTWFPELLPIKDAPWVGRVLEEIEKTGGAHSREKIIAWLASAAAPGTALHFLRALIRSGRPPTEKDLRHLFAGWPADRFILVLSDLIRHCARGSQPALLASLAQVVRRPPVPLSQEQAASLVAEVQRAATGPYQPDEREDILGVLVGGRSAPGGVEAQRHIAADRQAPAELRLQAALNLVKTAPGLHDETANYVADIAGIESSLFMHELCSVTFDTASRSATPDPLLAVMSAFRTNPTALLAFAERTSQVAPASLVAQKIVQTWCSPDPAHRDTVPAPAELREAKQFSELLQKEIALRALAKPEERPALLGCLSALDPETTSIAQALIEAADKRQRDVAKDVEKQIEAERQHLQDELGALRSQYERDIEQQVLDLLPTASSLWLLRQDLSSLNQVPASGGTRGPSLEDHYRRAEEAWAFLVDVLQKRGFRMFPESKTVAYDSTLHEFRGQGKPPQEGTPVRVVRLGLEVNDGGTWRRARRAIVT